MYVLPPTVVGDTLDVPFGACAPVHAPLAVHVEALDDQVKVAL
jgi:hypothetical protein